MYITWHSLSNIYTYICEFYITIYYSFLHIYFNIPELNVQGISLCMATCDIRNAWLFMRKRFFFRHRLSSHFFPRSRSTFSFNLFQINICHNSLLLWQYQTIILIHMNCKNVNEMILFIRVLITSIYNKNLVKTCFNLLIAWVLILFSDTDMRS